MCVMLFAVRFAYGQELEVVECKDGTYGFKNKETGVMVVPCKYDGVFDFPEGLDKIDKIVNRKFKIVNRKYEHINL